MRWEDFRQSGNVEDYRGESPGGGGGGGGFGLPGGAGGLGIGTVLVLGLVGWALGIDPRLLISGVEGLQGGGPSHYQESPRPSRAPRATRRRTRSGRFMRAVLGDTEDRWKEIFEKAGKRYTEPHLVVFPGRWESACGRAVAAMGPFYCPNDQKIYLDTSFFRDLEDAFSRVRRGQPRLPVRAGLRDRARGRPPRAEPARRSAEGAADAARNGQA